MVQVSDFADSRLLDRLRRLRFVGFHRPGSLKIESMAFEFAAYLMSMLYNIRSEESD